MESSIEEVVHCSFIENGLTLALAESCTGGSISASLTRKSGASEYFLGSIVAYSNELKEKILNVSPMTLKNKGAVSEQTVREMLEGMIKIAPADYVMAISGIAGPGGGSLEKPVGTICMGIKGKENFMRVWTCKISGKREAVVRKSKDILLTNLWEYSIKNK